MAQGVEITPDQTRIKLDPDLRYWASLGPYPGPAYEAYTSGQFVPEQETISHGINHAPETWFGTTLKNASFADGRAGDRFTLVLDAPFVVGFRVFLVREDGLTETLIDYSSFQPFNRAEHSVNRLKSAEFILAPNEEVTLLAHLQLGVMPSYTVDLFRPNALGDASFGWGVLMSAFYAFSLSCLLFGLGFQIAMKSWEGVGYVTMFLMFLALIAHSDGVLFRLLYPAKPVLHAPMAVGLLFGTATISFGIVARAYFAQQKTRRFARFVLAGLGLVTLALVSLTLWMPSPWLFFVACALVLASLSISAVFPSAAMSTEINPNIGLRTLIVLGIATFFVLLAWTTLGGAVAWLTPRAALKLAFLLMALSIMSYLTMNLIIMRRRHVAAIEERVDALEAEAEKSRQLLETERAYIRARETAAARQRQLATASHDIKQPLMSLRATFDAITLDMEQSVRDRLQEAFVYLENLSKTYVDGTVPETGEENDVAAELKQDANETFLLSVPLGTVQQMFKEAAVSKGLQLRVVDTSLHTSAPPLVLMRILSNLVSNALKYTETGAVLVGVRRADHSVWVCDTGAGMNTAEIEGFKEAYAKGDTSQGHGLGLSVCFELAATNNMPLSVSSVPGKGTVFSLSLSAYG
ncbi:MFS domain-containing histidine kinase [Planktotalea sp.]|uniref:MFS domain-containing histidine kinase n=1 Tax=Planktotalea sp. TaxID=2029877 RepID=UPI00329A2CA2